jgi:hypothetical protein
MVNNDARACVPAPATDGTPPPLLEQLKNFYLESVMPKTASSIHALRVATARGRVTSRRGPEQTWDAVAAVTAAAITRPTPYFVQACVAKSLGQPVAPRPPRDTSADAALADELQRMRIMCDRQRKKPPPSRQQQQQQQQQRAGEYGAQGGVERGPATLMREAAQRRESAATDAALILQRLAGAWDVAQAHSRAGQLTEHSIAGDQA